MATNSRVAHSPALYNPSDCISRLMVCILRLPQHPLLLGVCIHPPTLPSGTLDAVEATIPPKPALLRPAHRLCTFTSAQRHAFLPPDSPEDMLYLTTHQTALFAAQSLTFIAPWTKTDDGSVASYPNPNTMHLA